MTMLAAGDLQPFKLRIEDYELLGRSGAFEAQRVELIDGGIVEVNAEFQPHTYLKNRLAFRLQQMLERSHLPYEAVVEPTLAIPPYSMPEPDIAIVGTGPIDRDYFHPRQIALVIEVAASTLRSDLGAKLRLYAAGQVPEYWVVSLDAGEVHQFWSPATVGFDQRRVVLLAGELRSATLPDLAIDGAGIL